MKAIKFKYSYFVLGSILLPLILIAYVGFWLVTGVVEANQGLENTFLMTSKVIEQNETEVNEIFTSVFNKARECNGDVYCQEGISTEIHRLLANSKEEWPSYTATYFIRLNNNKNIEKLFLHGEWVEETVSTGGEKKVAQFLESPKSGYLRGIRIDATYSNMVYLRDFYSEAEIIVPVYEGTKVIGAVVKLYGD
jgi:hypothetical protein